MPISVSIKGNEIFIARDTGRGSRPQRMKMTVDDAQELLARLTALVATPDDLSRYFREVAEKHHPDVYDEETFLPEEP